MTSHSSVLAWRIPRTEEPGGLQSMGWKRVRHDWSDLAYMPTGTLRRNSHAPGLCGNVGQGSTCLLLF